MNKFISDIDLFKQALDHYEKNEYQNSIKKVSEAIDLNSDDPDIYFLKQDSLKFLRLVKISE